MVEKRSGLAAEVGRDSTIADLLVRNVHPYLSLKFLRQLLLTSQYSSLSVSDENRVSLSRLSPVSDPLSGKENVLFYSADRSPNSFYSRASCIDASVIVVQQGRPPFPSPRPLVRCNNLSVDSSFNLRRYFLGSSSYDNHVFSTV
jgi:hypothetical protein